MRSESLKAGKVISPVPSNFRCSFVVQFKVTDLPSSGAGNGADSAMPGADIATLRRIPFTAFEIVARAISSPIRESLFAIWPAVEVKAAAPPGAAGWRRLGRMWLRGAAGDGGASLLHLAARHAIPVAVKQLGLSAGLCDTPSIAFPFPRSAIGDTNPSAARLEVFQEFGCRGVGQLRLTGARGEVRYGLAQRGGLPIGVNRRKIAAEAVKLHLDRDDELPLVHGRVDGGRLVGIDRGHGRTLRFAVRRRGCGRAGSRIAAGRRRGGLRLLRQRCDSRLRLATGLLDGLDLTAGARLAIQHVEPHACVRRIETVWKAINKITNSGQIVGGPHATPDLGVGFVAVKEYL